jgi:hypothetical protein
MSSSTTSIAPAPLSLADRECPAYAGISPRMWDELKKSFPRILSPVARASSGRCYYAKKDIEAALLANKAALANIPFVPTNPTQYQKK